MRQRYVSKKRSVHGVNFKEEKCAVNLSKKAVKKGELKLSEKRGGGLKQSQRRSVRKSFQRRGLGG
jgi:hypothetical protein